MVTFVHDERVHRLVADSLAAGKPAAVVWPGATLDQQQSIAAATIR